MSTWYEYAGGPIVVIPIPEGSVPETIRNPAPGAPSWKDEFECKHIGDLMARARAWVRSNLNYGRPNYRLIFRVVDGKGFHYEVQPSSTSSSGK